MQKKSKQPRADAVVRDTDEGVELRLTGVVGDYPPWGFSDDHVADALANAEAPPTIVSINSPGGGVFAGMAIHAMLSRLSGLTVRVEGLAASIASVIALCGERLVMERGSMLMIHNPWNIAMGDSRELRKSADILDQIRESLLDIYEAKTNQPRDLLAEMMDDETWLTANEAVEWGFADAIVGEEGDEPEDRLAGMDLSILADARHAPARIAALVKDAPAPRRKPDEPAPDLTHLASLANAPERIAAMATSSASSRDPRATEPEPTETKESQMTTKATQKDPAAPANAPPPAGDDAEAAEAKALREEGAAAERKRAADIRAECAAKKIEPSFGEKLIDDGTPLDLAKQQIANLADYMAKDDAPGGAGPISSVHGITITRDERDTVRAGAALALLNRARPSNHKIEGDSPARQFANASLMEMARHFVEASGRNPATMSRVEIAQASMHSTSDFPLILENVVGKSLREGYELAPRTFVPIGVRETLPNFNEVSRPRLNSGPKMQKVQEGGEYTFGELGEEGERYRVFKYGKVLALTWEALINDDLNAFTRVPQLLGAAAAQNESDIFWAVMTGNPVMADGTALFHADHGNLAGSGGAIAVGTLGAGRSAMRRQKDGEHLINARPRFLIVPAAIETTAEQFIANNLVPDEPNKVNPFSGRLELISEPRLDDNSATAWYLAADPNAVDTIAYAYLQGEEGPQISTQEGFEVDGLKVKVRHCFGAKALDYRGLYKNPGA